MTLPDRAVFSGRVTGPRTPPRRGNGTVYAGLLVYAALFFVFYPRTFAIVDEDAYLTQSYLLRSGHLSYERSRIPPPHMTVNMDGRLVSKYPPGNSLYLLAFTLLGWRATFASGLVLAVAGTLLFAAVLRRLAPEADPSFALLYLCYPPVVLMSRTLMSDLLAATTVLLAFWLLLRPGPWAAIGSGLFLGCACLVRYSNAVFVPVFLVLAVTRPPARLRPALFLLLGFLPFAALIAGYNQYAFGGPFRFPMYLTGTFSPAFFPRNAWFYAVNLMLLYPLMLVAPLLAGSGRRLALGLPAYAVLLLYCLFSYVHAVPSPAERLTVGMRYLLPAAPFFVLGSAVVFDRWLRRSRLAVAVRWLALAALLVSTVAIHYRHQRHLATQERYRRMLYDAVPPGALLVCNKDVSELVSYAWGSRDYVHFAEFNVPVPVDRAIGRADAAYAALLYRPGRRNEVEGLLFETLLARHPASRLVAETERPCRFRLYRLKPAADSP